MNTTRIIEATTLMSIGALCAAAVFSLTFTGAHAASKHEVASTAFAQEAPVTITIIGKRLTAAEKADMLKMKNASAVTTI